MIGNQSSVHAFLAHTSCCACRRNSLNRSNGLYLVIGALIVAVIGLGAYVYQEESKPKGVEMNIGKDGVTIEEN